MRLKGTGKEVGDTGVFVIKQNDVDQKKLRRAASAQRQRFVSMAQVMGKEETGSTEGGYLSYRYEGHFWVTDGQMGLWPITLDHLPAEPFCSVDMESATSWGSPNLVPVELTGEYEHYHRGKWDYITATLTSGAGVNLQLLEVALQWLHIGDAKGKRLTRPGEFVVRMRQLKRTRLTPIHLDCLDNDRRAIVMPMRLG